MTRLKLLELIKGHAANNPNAVAIESEGLSIDYETLHNEIERFMETLAASGAKKGGRAALIMEPSTHLIISMIACAAAGVTYIPIDPRHHSERVEKILEIAKPDIIVCHSPDDTQQFTLTRTFSRSPESPLDDTLYIIFTSGTTGTPKGVCVSPSNLDALFEATKQLFDFTHKDRWLLAHSPAFDFSVWEIWLPLATGGTLVVPRSADLRNPAMLAVLIRDQRITILNQTPTAFLTLTKYMSISGVFPKDLRYIIFGGEKLLPRHLSIWVEHYGTAKPTLVNMYGVTEVTVHATYHEISHHDLLSQSSNIGSPLPGFEWIIIDPEGIETNQGELLLSGPQLSDGYLDNDAATRDAFIDRDGIRFYRTGDIVKIDPSRCLSYIGRRDRQVKVNGYRIELSEIEQALASQPDIGDVVAFVHTNEAKLSRIICAYTLNGRSTNPPPDLRIFMSRRLPTYMIPSKFVRLDALPVNINGKVDLPLVRERCK